MSRQEVAFLISFAGFLAFYLPLLAVFGFYYGTGVDVILSFIVFCFNEKWLDTVWPPKNKEELNYGKSN